MTAKSLWIVASVLGALAVIVGAFGAHALPGWLSRQGLDATVVARRLETLETGVRYHMYHTLALLAIAIGPRQLGDGVMRLPAWLLLTGIVLFSGCLYVYALTGIKVFAMIVPLGGISFIAGWVALAVAAARA